MVLLLNQFLKVPICTLEPKINHGYTFQKFIIAFQINVLIIVYCLQFNVRLGPKSPLDER
jgi:hypothetical protein